MFQLQSLSVLPVDSDARGCLDSYRFSGPWVCRGGFRLRPTRVEFWEGQPSRLHDRFVYSLTESGTKGEGGGEGEGANSEAWTITRLQP